MPKRLWMLAVTALFLVLALAMAENRLQPKGIRADADGNKIFDDLDAMMAREPLSWSTSAITVLNVDPTPEEITALKEAVGDFVIKYNKTHPHDREGHPWFDIKAFGADLTKSEILSLAHRAEVEHIQLDGVGSADNQG